MHQRPGFTIASLFQPQGGFPLSLHRLCKNKHPAMILSHHHRPPPSSSSHHRSPLPTHPSPPLCLASPSSAPNFPENASPTALRQDLTGRGELNLQPCHLPLLCGPLIGNTWKSCACLYVRVRVAWLCGGQGVKGGSCRYFTPEALDVRFPNVAHDCQTTSHM